jgi:L-lactate dehydrogenase complex protein LldG
MLDRALPFICENLILVVQRKNIIPTLHEAYELIADSNYDYGTLIAGPSKTADIEQSLVLGAHGPKTLAVFIKN